MKLTRQALRFINNNKSCCKLDPDTGILTFSLHYKSADQIIDAKLSTIDSPVISEEAISRLTGIVESIPGEFEVDFDIIIDDMMGYNPSILIEKYLASLHIINNKLNERKRSACFFWGKLLIIGIIVIALHAIAKKYNWYGPAQLFSTMVVVGLVDIFSEIFFEESFIFFFITRKASRHYEKLVGRIRTLRLMDSSGQLLYSTDTKNKRN